jgi:hypothetical protein
MNTQRGLDWFQEKMLNDLKDLIQGELNKMPNYLKYPTEKDTPSRKARKGMRTKVFVTNKGLNAKLRRERKAAREAAEEALEE